MTRSAVVPQAEADVLVVGAGVVGLAVAAHLQGAGREVVILERHDRIAAETSSRNSQVIHAGIYYPEGSLKARLCVEGRELVYERCQRLSIPHRETGKLIVATTRDECAALEELGERARRNGAPGIRWLTAAEVEAREPCVRAEAAILSPRSGIVDSHALCLSFLAEAEAAGAALVLGSELRGARPVASGYEVEAIDADGGLSRIRCSSVVNAGGLSADRVAELAGLDVDSLGLRQSPCKGDYFALAPGAPLRINGLVYPAPSGPGLGIHVTLDLGGRLRLGPDAEYVAAPRYDVDAGKATGFAEAAGRYLPGLRAAWLSPDGAGVRPKLAGPGEPVRDFEVREESGHGLPGWINLVGIESPGLTAAPAIARRVGGLLSAL